MLLFCNFLQLPLHSDGGASLLEVRGGHVGSNGVLRGARGDPAALARPARLREGPAPDRVHLGGPGPEPGPEQGPVYRAVFKHHTV